MAATDARPVPRKNVAFRVTFPILDADGDLVTGAASLDSEISKDGAAFADCTNEATEIATASGVYFLDLTSTEMNADTVAIIIKTGTAGAKTTTIVMYPEEAGDYRADLTTQGKADVNAEVLDVLNTDTFAEPGQEAPPATASLVKKIGYLHKAFRNKITQDATTLKVFADDAVTVDQKATVTDDGTTFTRGEIGTGP